MTLDRIYVVLALVYFGVGLVLGEHMGRTGDHGQMPTHAHLMLVGWVSMALYGLLYRAWPSLQGGWLPWVQFALHQAGTVVLCIGLYLIFGGIMTEEAVGPVIGTAVGVVILGWAVFVWLFLTRSGRSR